MGGGSKFTNSNAGCYVNFMEKLATNSRYGHFQLQGLSVLDDNTLHSLAGGKDCPIYVICDVICDHLNYPKPNIV